MKAIRREANLAITPGGRPGDASPLGTKGPRKLTDYTREIAHALMRRGFSKSHAIAVARNSQKRWAAGGGKVRPQVRAGAAASLARQKLLDHNHANEPAAGATIDLGLRPGQRYRHGWVPITPQASGHWIDPIPDKHRRHYSIIRGQRRQVVTFKGNEIGATKRIGNPKDDRTWAWVIEGDHVRHPTSHDAAAALMQRHIAQMVQTPRKLRPKRREPSFLGGLIQAGGLTGITAGQFSNTVDLGHRPYRYRHGWIPISGIAGAKEGDRVHKALNSRYEAHVARIDSILNDPAAHGLTPSDKEHGLDTYTDEHGNERVRFTKERARIQKQIVQTVLRREKRRGAKAERKALFLGGLPGAGKTTSLGKVDGLNERDYVTINPDIFKEELAKRGLVPKVSGMSPMEASALNHEESSNMALMLAEAARAQGLNIIWDITMNKASSVQKRLAPLREAGYTANSMFVDIRHEQSLDRVKARHRKGWAARLGDPTGRHLGQRYVPSGHVAGSKSKRGSTSANRDAFEEVKHLFDSHRLYNNQAGSMSLVGSHGAFHV